MSFLPLRITKILAFDRVRRAATRFLLVGDAAAVHVDAAALDEPRGLALRAGRRRPRASSSDDRPPGVRRRQIARRHVAEHLQQLASPTSPTDRRRNSFVRRGLGLRAPPPSPCTRRVTSRASSRCACALLGLARAAPLRAPRPRRVEEREELQIAHGVAIVDVEPELIELVRRRQRGIEPHRAAFGLAELRARRPS